MGEVTAATSQTYTKATKYTGIPACFQQGSSVFDISRTALRVPGKERI
jgi:hypothetical protein